MTFSKSKENARDVAASGRVACAEEAHGRGIVANSEPFASVAGGSVRLIGGETHPLR